MNANSTYLPALVCPYCGKEMESDPVPPSGPPTATKYSKCLRRCLGCRVAYSNTRKGQPTLIHEDPLANIPSQARAGVREVLGQAFNTRNRPIKLRKFGFSTSEDAVTWTVFSFLHRQCKEALPRLYQRLFGIATSQPPVLLIWGVPLSDGSRAGTVRDALVKVCDSLGEVPSARSEPDVLLDFGANGLVIAEVKYRSGNDNRTKANWDPYLSRSGVFKDPGQAMKSRRYELVRNWRIGHELAGTRPFVLANLGLGNKLDSDPCLRDFAQSLATSKERRFLPLPWADFLSAAEQAIGKYPRWMSDYLRNRGLR